MYIAGVYRAPSIDLVEVLETLTSDVVNFRTKGKVMVVGDFNARIAEEPSIIQDNNDAAQQ